MSRGVAEERRGQGLDDGRRRGGAEGRTRGLGREPRRQRRVGVHAVHGGQHRVDEAPARVTAPDRDGDLAAEAPGRTLDEGRQQGVAVGEPAVDRGPRHAGDASDVGDRRTGHAAGDEAAAGGVEDAVCGLARRRPGDGRGHRRASRGRDRHPPRHANRSEGQRLVAAHEVARREAARRGVDGEVGAPGQQLLERDPAHAAGPRPRRGSGGRRS